MNYADIRSLAAEQNVTVNDLIALSPNNDPFFVGRPNDWKQARWFHELWTRFGYTTGVHLRRVHYQVISQNPVVLLPNRWSFAVTSAIYDEAGALAVPEGALLIGEQYAWKGPREKDGKRIAGEAIRFLAADQQSLPPQIRQGVTYYVARVGEVKTAGTRYRWIQISDRRESATAIRLSPGSAGVLAEPYENTEKCWDYLTQAGKVARYLNLVRIDAFVDRRNPDPRLYAEVEEPQPYVDVNARDWETPRLPDMPELPDYSLWGYSGRQRYHLELWAEKSTMNDVLIPLCERYQINLVTGLGEMSITSVLGLLERIKQGGRPAIIWYVSDYDPAGQSMPVAVSRKIEYMVRGDEDGESLDIRLLPVVLTADQVARYNLPRTPIKETEMRAASFEARHGEGAVELDALEALNPGELNRILGRSIQDFYDNQLTNRVYREQRRALADLAQLQQEVYSGHSEEIASLTNRYNAIRDQFAQALGDWAVEQRRLWAEIARQLGEQSYDQVLEDHPIPEAEESDALWNLDPLYHSERRYGEQLAYYKAHQRKDSPEVEVYE